MNDELAALAAAQGGAFTRAQAEQCGYSDGDIRGLRKREWLVLYRGVYAERTRFAIADGNERHVLHAAGRVLASGLDLVASHRTGALAHRLPLLGKPPAVPQVTQSPRCVGDTSRSSGLYVATLAEHDRATTADGVPVTSLARTACDVARRNPFRDGVVVADGVLGRGVPSEELLEVARRCADWPGGRRGLEVARFADGRADGPLESITRVAYSQEGLPAPETQVEIWSPEGLFLGLVDFLFREQRVIGEADGMGKYDREGALRDEKRREMGLSRCGLLVVRNVWDDVWMDSGRRDLGHRMRLAFALAARTPPVPGVTFRTPTLQQLVDRRTARLPAGAA